MEGEWLECVIDNDYEIFSEYPYPIRRKGSDKIIGEHVGSDGYIVCYLNRKPKYIHRIIAEQFIPNPNNLPQVDHINQIRTDYRIENLRWVTRSENQKNRSCQGDKWFDDIPHEFDAIEVEIYGDHQFDNYWFDPIDNFFYFYNGIRYKRLRIFYDDSKVGCVVCRDIKNKQVRIYYPKFKRLYGLMA